ncbi:MAG: lipocalin family protein [Bacteroides sp.]|nr:lipocalin family protein [Bacteroides sp.]
MTDVPGKNHAGRGKTEIPEKARELGYDTDKLVWVEQN